MSLAFSSWPAVTWKMLRVVFPPSRVSLLPVSSTSVPVVAGAFASAEE